jgi:hypothetical protein
MDKAYSRCDHRPAGKSTDMPTKRDVVEEQLAELRQDLHDLWVALTVDPKQQKRKERAWAIVAGVSGAVATLAARRAATKIWAVLTGEVPPPVKKAEEEAAEMRQSGGP